MYGGKQDLGTTKGVTQGLRGEVREKCPASLINSLNETVKEEVGGVESQSG